MDNRYQLTDEDRERGNLTRSENYAIRNDKIINDFNRGMKKSAIARKYGMSWHAVRKVIERHNK